MGQASKQNGLPDFEGFPEEHPLGNHLFKQTIQIERPSNDVKGLPKQDTEVKNKKGDTKGNRKCPSDVKDLPEEGAQSFAVLDGVQHHFVRLDACLLHLPYHLRPSLSAHHCRASMRRPMCSIMLHRCDLLLFTEMGVQNQSNSSRAYILEQIFTPTPRLMLLFRLLLWFWTPISHIFLKILSSEQPVLCLLQEQ